MTRRTALALGASALFAGRALPQAASEKSGGPPAGAGIAPRRAPLICCYSGNLSKVEYPQLGFIAQQIGYEGVDLTVMAGGHVNPQIANVDLVRAIESVRGPGLEVPLISTNITNVADYTAYPVLAIAGHTQVHMYRTGYWPWGTNAATSAAPNVTARLAQVRNDLLSLLPLGQSSQMMALIPNRAGFVGEAVWDTQTIIGDLSPQWVGYSFDPSQATAEGGAGGWEIALRLALPRLKAVAVQDFVWAKTGAAWKMQMCPMGEGMVDWDAFFGILAANHFTGPLSIHYEYQSKDDPAAMTKDLEFVRARVRQFWP
jgi:sugar phosphate isomerase/epimerase